MVTVTDGSERPRVSDGFRLNPVGQWTEAPGFDNSYNPRFGLGIYGQHPEAGGYISSENTVPELLEIDGPMDILTDRQVKAGRVKRIAVGDLNVPEMPREWFELNLSDCTGLRGIPDEMEVGVLDLCRCIKLKIFPKGLVARKLYLDKCLGLEYLAERLHCNRAYIIDCINLRELPEDMQVYKELVVIGCDIEIPKGIVESQLANLHDRNLPG